MSTDISRPQAPVEYPDSDNEREPSASPSASGPSGSTRTPPDRGLPGASAHLNIWGTLSPRPVSPVPGMTIFPIVPTDPFANSPREFGGRVCFTAGLPAPVGGRCARRGSARGEIEPGPGQVNGRDVP